MEQHKIDIATFIHDLSDIPHSDILVNVADDSTQFIPTAVFFDEEFKLDIDASLKKVMQAAAQYRKEADINSLCYISHFIAWNVKDVQVRTPLFICPVDWKIQKTTGKFTGQLLTEQAEVNPFVRRQFRELCGVDLEGFEWNNPSGFIDQLKSVAAEQNLKIEVLDLSGLGNFHYHRYHILRELEGIQRADYSSSLVSELLGDGVSEPVDYTFPRDVLTPVDSDQLSVFDSFAKQNTIVHGPPGTGKSQVLINILGKSLFSGLNTLVVSEKKVALQVLEKKLSQHGLSAFSFTVHSQVRSRDLIAKLKSTWSFLESQVAEKKPNLRLSEQHLARLQLLLDRLNASDTFGGISYSELNNLRQPYIGKKVEFSSNVPELKQWLEWKGLFEELDYKWGSLKPIQGYKAAFFTSVSNDQLLENVKISLDKLKQLEPNLTLEKLQNLVAKLGRCQLIENEWYKSSVQIISKPKEEKKYVTQLERLHILKDELLSFETEKNNWKSEPSKTQLESWSKAERGWWKKRQRQKSIIACLKNKELDVEIALSNWNTYLHLKEQILGCESYFKQLGLPTESVHLIAHGVFLKQLKSDSSGELAELASWPEEQRRLLLQEQHELIRLSQQLTSYFELGANESIALFIKEKSETFETLLPFLNRLKELPNVFFRTLKLHASLSELEACIVHSNWKKIEAVFPELVDFDGDALKKLLGTIVHSQEVEAELFAHQLIENQRTQFTAFEQLLRTPSTKLKGADKLLKAELKKGKALLVREFAKSRSHLSIRELLEGDAQKWIQLMLPIWMATPNQVADHFPLKRHLFDVVVFDEASQIPLPSALGALYRSKRALVAGDSQQMSPSSYFGKASLSHDLLHQASFYYAPSKLRHHYRSAYTDLISFSNKHFYNNELIVYPSSVQKSVCFRHYSPNGRFENRRNSVEANDLASYLETVKWTNTIGIVAFSEEQLKAIWEACSQKVQDKITVGQENGTVFFKALEQVQGDEADILLISLGYARNEEDQFQMRFGPLNFENGYKRLNVLLTRAIQEMHFFLSVESSEFGISANESVNLLRRYLQQLENEQKESKLEFPYNLVPSILKGNKIMFNGITQHIPKATDLITFYQVLKFRGWELQFEL